MLCRAIPCFIFATLATDGCIMCSLGAKQGSLVRPFKLKPMPRLPKRPQVNRTRPSRANREDQARRGSALDAALCHFSNQPRRSAVPLMGDFFPQLGERGFDLLNGGFGLGFEADQLVARLAVHPDQLVELELNRLGIAPLR